MIAKNTNVTRRETGETFTVESVNDGMVTFTNGAQCSLNTFNEKFTMDSVDTSNIQVTEHVQPETINDKYSAMLKMVENLDNSKIPTVSTKPTIKMESGYIEEINENGSSAGTSVIVPTVNFNEYVNNDNVPNTNQVNTPSAFVNPQNDIPELQMYQRLKRNNEITVNLTLKVKMPVPTQMQVLDDMFEYSIVDFLATDVLNSISDPSQKIEEQIKGQINDYKNNQKKKTSRSTKRQNPGKKNTVQKTPTKTPKESAEIPAK